MADCYLKIGSMADLWNGPCAHGLEKLHGLCLPRILMLLRPPLDLPSSTGAVVLTIFLGDAAAAAGYQWKGYKVRWACEAHSIRKTGARLVFNKLLGLTIFSVNIL